MTDQDSMGPREMLERLQRTAIDKALDAMVDLYAEDAVYEFPFTRPGVPTRMEGRERIADFLRSNWENSPLRYTEYRNVVVRGTDDPEVIVVEQDAIGTSTATGRDFALPNLLVLRVRDGRITHVRDYVNVLAAAEAMGWTS